MALTRERMLPDTVERRWTVPFEGPFGKGVVGADILAVGDVFEWDGVRCS